MLCFGLGPELFLQFRGGHKDQVLIIWQLALTFLWWLPHNDEFAASGSQAYPQGLEWGM